jgi:UDP-glucose 4-epimerase
MKVVVTGASGNVGTSVLAALAEEDAVDEVLGISRRRPQLELPKVAWAEADVAESELAPLFAGADAVVHLAWAIQPSRDEAAMERVNVLGRSSTPTGAAAAASTTASCAAARRG